MSDVKNNVIVNSLVEAQEAASLINFTVRRLEQRINDSICDADEYRRVIIKLEDRIRRLEEAGDRMEEYILDQTNTRFIICAVQWREAKEAKL